VVVGKAFAYWIPLICSMELLSSKMSEEAALLKDLAQIQIEINKAEP
jgi:hypothetical protein